MAKEFLSENGINYTEKNINIDRQARNQMIQMGVTGVPAFLIDEDLVVGLDKDKILSLVKN